MKQKLIVITFFAVLISCKSTDSLMETHTTQCPEDAPVLTPAPLEEPWAIEWWMPRHEEKLNEEGREDAEILLVGDSITHGWESTGSEVWERYFGEYKTYNIGYSGDRTENVLWRFQNGEIDGIHPKVAMVMIGTNNTGHRQDHPDCTAMGIERIVDSLQEKLPDTHILLLAIFPRGADTDDELRILNEEINQRIEVFGEKERVTFLNLNHTFLNDEGEILEEVMPDLLHPNEEGYELWAAEIFPRLIDLLN
ncbi:MAG: acetylglucosamine-6-sulfatase [Balneolaceae bacterium]|nr:MAG: acetylglucosamine-6-sulfatase [Balneolaceae bacterium]